MFSTGFLQKCLAAFVLMSFISLYAAQSTDPSATLGVGNYILSNRRQYLSVIANMEAVIANAKQNNGNQVSTIDTQSALLLQRLSDISATFNPLDVLNVKTQACVEKYRANIATADSVRTAISACSTASTTAFVSYIAVAETTKRNLNSYYISNFETMITNCNTTYPSTKSLVNYTLCIQSVVTTVNGITVTNQKNFDAQIQSALCSAQTQINTSIDCSFSVQFSTISAIGENIRLINNCIAGTDVCPVCDTSTTTTTPAPPQCAYSVQIKAADAAATNTNIANPFLNLDSKATCVLITKTA